MLLFSKYSPKNDGACHLATIAGDIILVPCHVYTTNLKISHSYMKSMGALSWNELQSFNLQIGPQVGSPTNGFQGNLPNPN